jgi:hypothetical protein
VAFAVFHFPLTTTLPTVSFHKRWHSDGLTPFELHLGESSIPYLQRQRMAIERREREMYPDSPLEGDGTRGMPSEGNDEFSEARATQLPPTAQPIRKS